ncbi:MAG: ABC transporter permease [Bdellovibrionaceae bacterium]|nr:ABC transporter permease [Pseudobdellovibrionaceae bacterium]
MIRIISWVCLIGVTVGVTTLIIVMSVMNGFNESIRNKLLLTKPHVILKGNESELKTWKEKLNNQNIVSADIVENQDVVVRTVEGLYGGAVAKGMDTSQLQALFKRLTDERVGEEGSFLQVEDAAILESGEVILGKGLATSLSVFEGDQIVVIPPEALLLPSGEMPYYARARVKAILQTELQDVDSQTLYYNIDGGLKALSQSRSRFQELELRLTSVNQVEDIKKIAINMGAQVDTWKDRDRAMLFALKMEKFIIGTIIGISTLITAFSILTVLVLLITQKKKDIGILMSMGCSRSSTRWMFVRIGLILSFLGLGSGMILGLSLSFSLDEAKLNILPNIYYDTSIPIAIEWSLIITALIGGSIVAFVGSYVPTSLILRFSPSEALRAKV